MTNKFTIPNLLATDLLESTTVKITDILFSESIRKIKYSFRFLSFFYVTKFAVICNVSSAR